MLKYGMKDTKDWDLDTKPLADLPNQLGSRVTGKGVPQILSLTVHHMFIDPTDVICFNNAVVHERCVQYVRLHPSLIRNFTMFSDKV